MTISGAVSVMQRIVTSVEEEFKSKGELYFAQMLDEAWVIVRQEALSGTCNIENRPVEKGNTPAWVNMPEGEEKSLKQTLDEMQDCFNEFCTAMRKVVER